MKKVLIGLVIAVMMTGSGYSKELPNEQCDFLLKNVQGLIPYLEENIYELYDYKYGDSDKPELRETAFRQIQEAHYYATTWSALCD